MLNDTIPERICTSCKNPFPATLEYFYSSKNNVSCGLNSICKECCKLKTRIYYKEHREAQLLKSKERQPRRNKQNKNIYNQIYRLLYKDKMTEYRRKREILRKMSGFFTKQEIRDLFIAQDGKCFHCGIDFYESGFHRDHWISLSRGGFNTIDNIKLLCPSCNLSKGSKLPHEWCPERY